VLTVVGLVEVFASLLFIARTAGVGQFARRLSKLDIEEEIRNSLPGYARMQAIAAREAPFDHGRQTDESFWPAWEVTTKSVGALPQRAHRSRYRSARNKPRSTKALQLELPVVVGEAQGAFCTCRWMGREFRLVKKEDGRSAGQRRKGQPAPYSGSQTGMRLQLRRKWDKQGYPNFVIPIPPRIPERSRRRGKSLAGESMRKLGGRGWSRALQKVVMGDGARMDLESCPPCTFRTPLQIVDLYHARQHLWEVARRLFPNEGRKAKKPG